MRKELEALCTINTELEKRAVPDPKKETTLKDLRANPLVTSKVEQFLPQLDDSSCEESEDDDKTKKKLSRGRRHTLRSGKASKLTSCVVNPQLWPDSHSSLSYVSKDKKYDLTLAEFAAGYAAILQRPTLPPQELRARIIHLSSLMYLATQFTWSLVRDLHAAMLFEIECGWADWGDLFTHLESRILQAPVKPSSRAGVSRREGSAAVFFCRYFQHGACKLNKNHYGTLKGERKWLQHICAQCWVDTCVTAPVIQNFQKNVLWRWRRIPTLPVQLHPDWNFQNCRITILFICKTQDFLFQTLHQTLDFVHIFQTLSLL